MKRAILSILLLALLLPLLGDIASADGPPVTAPPSLPPIIEPIEAACDGMLVYVETEDQCNLVFDGLYTASELEAYFDSIGVTDRVVGIASTLLGIKELRMASAMRYLVVHTDTFVGQGPVTRILVSATCRAYVDGENLAEDVYYQCVAIFAAAIGDVKTTLCPALAKMLEVWSKAISPGGKKTAESLLLAQTTYCVGAKVMQPVRQFFLHIKRMVHRAGAGR